MSSLLIFYLIFYRIWFWRLEAPKHERSDIFTFQVWSSFSFMTKFNHMLIGWDCRISLILRYETCLPYSTVLSSTDSHFFYQVDTSFYTKKTYCSKGEVETTFKNFLTSKPFYHTSMNNLFNQWLKYIVRDHTSTD